MIKATFEVSQDWQSGLVGYWIIENTGSTAVESWDITFETTFDIDNVWDGNMTNRDGNRYTISAQDWNSRLAPGQSARVGFVGNNATNYPHQAVLSSEIPPGPTAVTTDNRPSSPNPTINVVEAVAPALTETVPPKPSVEAPSIEAPSIEETGIETVDFTVANQWTNGFVANLSFTYNGSETLDGWELKFDAPFPIANLWNGTLVAQNDGSYTIRNVSWNSNLSSGDTITLGFKVNTPFVEEPANYAFNGTDVENTSAAPSVVIPPVAAPPPAEESSPVAAPIVDTPPDPTPPNDPPAAPVENTPSTSGNPASGYGEALQKSFLFYEAQRSGDLPRDNRIAWRGDSALNDGADVGVDLTGGYYDAGDHVKFGFPMAASMTMLSWGVLEYTDAYRQSGQLDEALDAIKWGTDYLLKAHISDGNTTQAFYGQVGDGGSDHAYWGPPETLPTPRPAYKIDKANPGSDLAAETAATLASASILFRQRNPAYADQLLDNAEQLYAFADNYRGRYSDSISQARNYYNSWSGYNDELAWGAAWLYKATGDQKYLNKAKQNYQAPNIRWTQNWDDKSYGAGVLLAQITNEQTYRRGVENWLDNWVSGGINTTNGGLAWLDRWGSLRYSANTAFIAGVYSDTVNAANGKYDNFSRSQIDYILGDNPARQSYLVGFGNDFPENIHHRSASGTRNIGDPAPNRHILHGALVGGPGALNDFSYNDSRNDFTSNEVALDYNAGFTGAVARLYGQDGGNLLSNGALIALSEVGLPT